MKQDTDRRILKLLEEKRSLSARETAERLGISGASIRRAFRRLAELGEVHRIHGRIEALNRGMDPAYPFFLRMQWFTKEKEALAARTVPLLAGCRSVFIDGGTTTAHLGMMLRDSSLRIITNSLALNDVLSNGTTAESGPEVILTGGRVNRKSAILLGPEAESSLDHFHADAAVISGSALDGRFLYDNMEEAAAIQRKMIANSDRVIVIADASKFGQTAPSAVVPVEKLSLIVTNFISENYRIVQELKRKGIEFSFCTSAEFRENTPRAEAGGVSHLPQSSRRSDARLFHGNACRPPHRPSSRDRLPEGHA